jgi:hypothetical protein
VKNLRRVLFLTACICCCFYALFLFDTLGDSRGWFQSYWILLVMSFFPLLLFIINRAHRRLRGKLGFAGRTGFYLDDNMFEMVTIGPAQAAEEDGDEATDEHQHASENLPEETAVDKDAEKVEGSSETVSALHMP